MICISSGIRASGSHSFGLRQRVGLVHAICMIKVGSKVTLVKVCVSALVGSLRSISVQQLDTIPGSFCREIHKNDRLVYCVSIQIQQQTESYFFLSTITFSSLISVDDIAVDFLAFLPTRYSILGNIDIYQTCENCLIRPRNT